jgi:2-iminoacetate synthase
MNTIQKAHKGKAETNFIEPDRLRNLLAGSPPDSSELERILAKASLLKGLSLEDAARLLLINDPAGISRMMETAKYVKEEIYGKRMVLFAPLYIGNKCSNNCTYCAFRASNRDLKRTVLSQEQIRSEVSVLLAQGHKRLLMLCGESVDNDLDFFLESLKTAYAVQTEHGNIRRINVEIAPMDTDDFARLKEAKIGTYACFQETYDPDLYKIHHPSGPKADYLYRLTVMDRAMAGGIDDVGIGALFGLGDYRFEVLGLLQHAAHLEEVFGCGPHTVSVPRIEPADHAPSSEQVPSPVSDDNFKKIIAILRISLPWTGIILSTRESETLRNELFNFGISQISAGSRTNPGAYAEEDNRKEGSIAAGSQFSLGDHRNLDEVISTLIDRDYIPSFCTGCYRKGRVGQDFMDMAKPGLIKEFCMPNGLFTFVEYLEEHASSGTKSKGYKLVNRIIDGETKTDRKVKMVDAVTRIKGGERDIYY